VDREFIAPAVILELVQPQPLTFASIRQAPLGLPDASPGAALFLFGWALSVLIWKFRRMEERRAHWVSSVSVARAQRIAKRKFQEHAHRHAVFQMPPLRLRVQDDGTGYHGALLGLKKMRRPNLLAAAAFLLWSLANLVERARRIDADAAGVVGLVVSQDTANQMTVGRRPRTRQVFGKRQSRRAVELGGGSADLHHQVFTFTGRHAADIPQNYIIALVVIADPGGSLTYGNDLAAAKSEFTRPAVRSPLCGDVGKCIAGVDGDLEVPALAVTRRWRTGAISEGGGNARLAVRA
jgi:hypothetical protein